MDPVWHRPCCKKTQNGVEIDHIVFAVQTAHFQSLSKAAISLNGMTVMSGMEPRRYLRPWRYWKAKSSANVFPGIAIRNS